ncbi:Mini-ribonuclease 3 [Acetanaerobacterium elongatum]|uniref:Mini-ribonuclease 3 n=1 Tax=Acetanaerobacterium elongatum TaxID=258515 RepID=A0A1H0B4W0_9FIRM|nr:ribonuclease III domain-containing protein [Acetanaerobacterium elongatum]SDN40646.1 ribonuclease-3 family protein [Acetanaerobacterium elongatum]
MQLSIEEASNPKLKSPLALAFLGDAVYELLVREHLSQQGSMPAHALHVLAVRLVRASAQAHATELIAGVLTEEETAILKRGRNANSTTVPKNANPADYRMATGLEALFGYLYLKGEQQRINELFKIIWQSYCEENRQE